MGENNINFSNNEHLSNIIHSINYSKVLLKELYDEENISKGCYESLMKVLGYANVMYWSIAHKGLRDIYENCLYHDDLMCGTPTDEECQECMRGYFRDGN